MKKKKISAIICTHNRSDLLAKAIESLIGQTMDKSHYEIIVVDNASTDQTRELCEGYRDIDNFRYIYEEEAGLTIARNLGLIEAKGKYVGFLDDDAIASREWLERIVHAFETITPPPASVGGKILPIWEVPKPEWFPDDKTSLLSILDYGERPIIIKYPRVLFGTNMAFLRDALLDVGGFSTNLGRKKNNLLSGEEVDIFKKFKEKKLPVFYQPDITVSHLIPKERLTEKWLYRRLYWTGRSAVLMWSGMSRSTIFKEVGISLQKIGQKLIKLYHIRNESGSAANKVSRISSIYREVGRMRQLLLDLRNPPSIGPSKVNHTPEEKYISVDMKDGWQAFGMVEISSGNEKTFDGDILKLTGTGRSGDQSFALSETYDISPAKRYRFTGAMRIDFISQNTSFFKCRLYQRGRWLKNFESNKYDFRRKGQWQELTVEFASPKGEGAALSISIEKRPRAEEIRASIYVAAMKLEMIE